MPQRIYLFDSIKFFLVFLVVIGHMMEPYRSSSFNGPVYGWIYLFHMPLFILISGYFSKQHTNVEKFWWSEIRLLETLAVFHVGSIVFKIVVFGKSIGLADIVIPGYGSWYLLSLAYWRAILQYTPGNWLQSVWLIPATVCISLLGGYIPVGGVFSVQRTFTFLPFFFLGYSIRQNQWLEKVRLRPVLSVVLIAIISAVVLSICDMGNGGGKIHSVMMGTYSYFKGDDFIPYPLLSRALFLILSCIMCIAVMSVFPNRKLPLFTDNGKDTLFFYVYHAFVYRQLLFLFRIEPSTVNLILGAIVVMSILIAIKRIKALWWLLNPVTKMIDKNL